MTHNLCTKDLNPRKASRLGSFRLKTKKRQLVTCTCFGAKTSTTCSGESIMGSFLGPFLYCVWSLLVQSSPRDNVQSTQPLLSHSPNLNFEHWTYPIPLLTDNNHTISLSDLNITVHSLSFIEINDLTLDYFDPSDWDYIPQPAVYLNDDTLHQSNLSSVSIIDSSNRRRLASKDSYVRSPVTMTWSEAQSYCETHYGSLASVTTVELQKAADNACNGQCWIGLKARKYSHKFVKWTDGRRIKYQHWSPSNSRSNPKGSTCRSGSHFCSKEGGHCQCLGLVDYGKRHRWKQKWSYDSIHCANPTFGDPFPGTYKECCCRETVSLQNPNYKKVLAKKGP